MAEAATPPDESPPPRRRRLWPGGLSARLLVLTAIFTTLAGALVIPPSLAAFEEQWLLDRLRAAELASLAADITPEAKVNDRLRAQLLEGAGVTWIAVGSEGTRRLVLEGPRMRKAPYLVDLTSRSPLTWAAPFWTLLGDGSGTVRVKAPPRFRQADFIEVVMPDGPLREQLLTQLARLAVITAVFSAIAGGLVYLSLNLLLVRPMQRLTRAMERFRADPEDPAARIVPSHRNDEIGRAEAELDRMQADLVAALSSRARLAALGEAVAKINHDLRNMLTSAQLASERLAAIGDPKVASAMPRLERALDRAIRLASDVLAYGKTQEAPPEARPTKLAAAIEDAAEDAGLSAAGVALEMEVEPAAQVVADPDQLHRILVNLLRNARQAIQGQEGREAPGLVRASLAQEGEVNLIRLADNGPGLSERVQSRLFQPFSGAGRAEGAGLGLAIARELAQGHGGDLLLVETGPSGATFELRLPGLVATPPPRRKSARAAETD
jgi:signal transduction histidine kinase